MMVHCWYSHLLVEQTRTKKDQLPEKQMQKNACGVEVGTGVIVAFSLRLLFDEDGVGASYLPSSRTSVSSTASDFLFPGTSSRTWVYRRLEF